MQGNVLVRCGRALAVQFVMSLMVLMLGVTSVQADMLVSPLRVHLDDDTTSAMVTLRNPSNGPRTYRLEWVEQSLSVDGVYKKYKQGEQVKHLPASPYLRLSPRQITVPARGNQSVRVHFRPAANMAAGEYRSHLLFSVVPELSEPMSVQKVEGDDGMSLTLNMQLSMAIPVVVKNKVEQAPVVKITAVEPVLSTKPGQASQLAVTLQRSGLVGSFGRVLVEMQLTAESPVERIGISDNVSVFADVDQRRVLLSLRDQKIPAGAWLRVVYEGKDEFKGIVWDQQVFQVR